MGYTLQEWELTDEEWHNLYLSTIITLGKLVRQKGISNSGKKYSNELYFDESCIKQIGIYKKSHLLLIGMFFIKKMWPIIHLEYVVFFNQNYVKNYSDVIELKKHLKRHYKIWFTTSKRKGEFTISWRAPLRGERILEKTKTHAFKSVKKEIIPHIMETFEILGLIIDFFQPEIMDKILSKGQEE